MSIRQYLVYALTAFAVFTIAASVTMVNIRPGERGVVIKMTGKPLPENRIIALHGERGPQAKLVSPGIHFFGNIPFVRRIEKIQATEVPDQRVVILVARDGETPPQGENYAPAFEEMTMLNAAEFLTTGGRRGPQMTFLRPGRYFLHPYLWDARTGPAFHIQAGEVGVVRDMGGPVSPEVIAEINGTPLVPAGYRGIWVTPLTTGLWYEHPEARRIIMVATTERNFTYRNGVDSQNQPYTEAIEIRTKDGFIASVEVRISVVVRPENAPKLVALLGDPDRVEFSIQEQDELTRLEAIVILPEVRSAVRNVAETMNALTLINSRSEFENRIFDLIEPSFRQRHIDLQNARIGQIDLTITPEGATLVQTQTDRRVAEEQVATFTQRRKAEEERAELVRATAMADLASQIAESELQETIETNRGLGLIARSRAQGQAELERAERVAEANRLRVEALGVDNFTRLEMIRIAGENEVLITPTFISGGEAQHIFQLGK